MKNKDEKKRIVVVHLVDILKYPPVINLVENMLNNGHFVYLVSQNIKELPESIRKHKNLKYTDIPIMEGNNLTTRIRRKIIRTGMARKAVRKYMQRAEVVWTTTDSTVLILGKMLFDYRHVLQLMELEKWCPGIGGSKRFKFPIDDYARKAWKVVVPEINRAYIQRTWWQLKRTPYVLPNKPYSLSPGEPLESMSEGIEKIKKEKRKVLLYLGLVMPERNLEEFAKAVKDNSDNYCLYVVGRIPPNYQTQFDDLINKYPFINYLGYYPAPKHLLFLQYAYLGLIPYIPQITDLKGSDRYELNALYCAPNKIFEYAGYGVPMIGTDVPGLRQPFEQYDIGVCCKELSADAIVDAIHKVEEHHDEMSKNCKRFYDSVDLDKIVEDILYEEV